MNVNIIATAKKSSMEPLTLNCELHEYRIAGETLKQFNEKKFSSFTQAANLQLFILDDFHPSAEFAEKLADSKEELIVKDADDRTVAWLSASDSVPETAATINPDKDSFIIKYPWDLLAVNEEITGALKESTINGTVRERVTIDGFIRLGKNSVLLPGVYIEGNAIIGQNCKIGPNCYIRGNTSIGDNCHIGQAVEIKNSILMDNVSAGHLSYIGDSIIGENSNMGAGTITANFRHDGKTHRSAVDGVIIDTGRRKFGTVVGENVHTGIHTSIYPGRKIWPDMCTMPGDIVKKDIKFGD